MGSAGPNTPNLLLEVFDVLAWGGGRVTVREGARGWGVVGVGFASKVFPSLSRCRRGAGGEGGEETFYPLLHGPRLSAVALQSRALMAVLR